MEPNRIAVVGSYVRHHPGQPENRYELEPIDMARLVSATISAVRREVQSTPFNRNLDFANGLPDRYNPDAHGFLVLFLTLRCNRSTE